MEGLSDIRAKRLQLERLSPAPSFGPPNLHGDSDEDDINDDNDDDDDDNRDGEHHNRPYSDFGSVPIPHRVPDQVSDIIKTFAAGNFESSCVPRVPGFLETVVPYEVFPHHCFYTVSPHDRQRALDLLKFAIDIHRTCTYNSAHVSDKSAWCSTTRHLLSINPNPGSVPAPPSPFKPPSRQQLFSIIDGTAKRTSKHILPEHPNINIDLLLTFNSSHAMVASTIGSAASKSLHLNPFDDSSISQVIIVLGVAVKAPGGDGGQLAAEYELAVWGMKAVRAVGILGGSYTPGYVTLGACDVALSLSVCGHVWSVHLTYRKRLRNVTTHGPVVVGSTDTLYGTMKVIKFVCEVKTWAKEKVWCSWKDTILRYILLAGS